MPSFLNVEGDRLPCRHDADLAATTTGATTLPQMNVVFPRSGDLKFPLRPVRCIRPVAKSVLNLLLFVVQFFAMRLGLARVQDDPPTSQLRRNEVIPRHKIALGFFLMTTRTTRQLPALQDLARCSIHREKLPIPQLWEIACLTFPHPSENLRCSIATKFLLQQQTPHRKFPPRIEHRQHRRRIDIGVKFRFFMRVQP